jgi:hypothetical protein
MTDQAYTDYGAEERVCFVYAHHFDLRHRVAS